MVGFPKVLADQLVLSNDVLVVFTLKTIYPILSPSSAAMYTVIERSRPKRTVQQEWTNSINKTNVVITD